VCVRSARTDLCGGCRADRHPYRDPPGFCPASRHKREECRLTAGGRLKASESLAPLGGSPPMR
jgi:hypothetical protein